jgi:diketogulonate reductase-like aldo/keto reductase
MKKLLIALLMLAVMQVAFSGCGSTSNENGNTPAQTSEPTAEPSDGASAEPTPSLEPAPANASDGQGVFDLEKGSVILNNGVEMPIVGIGTFTLTPEQASESVYSALTSGYKLIDTAYAYNNEEGVGEGVKRSGVAREDVFITTKLWPSDYDNAAQAIDGALERLGVEYIDLLLLHQAWGNYVGAYQAMEVALSEGKVRAIGVSNFYTQAFDEIMAVAKVTPAVLQNERNPYFQQIEMQKYIAPYGTVLMDWFPLGGRSERQTSLFEDKIILEIAEAHDVTAAQVILRWHIQSGGIAIPGSTNPDHIKENITIFDFELTDEEMEQMATLETGIPAFDFSTPNTMPGFTPPQDSDN